MKVELEESKVKPIEPV